MDSRSDSFAQGITGSPVLAQKRMIAQVQAGGLYPGQNGRSEETYNADQPFIGQALKAGY